jgi:hypothetical protein
MLGKGLVWRNKFLLNGSLSFKKEKLSVFHLASLTFFRCGEDGLFY